ncbi:MAG: FG-GAP-like repeat-containing protein [Phycisphaerales bacterium]
MLTLRSRLAIYGVATTICATLVLTDPLCSAGLSYLDKSGGLQTPAMDGGRTEIEFGDVNGDGNLDLVSIGDHGSPFVNTNEHGVMVWFGNGAGQWSVFQNGNFGYGGVALGDVNNDGLMDIGYGMHHDYAGGDFGDQLLEVALGDGTGMNWTPWDNGLASNGETWGMFGTDFADVDNDGDLDVGSLSFGCCAGIHVYLNHGDGTWTQSFGSLGGNSAMDFVFGDVNGDGLADFATAHGNGTVYIGDGKGGFVLADGNFPGSSWRSGVSLGDVNDDGRDDLSFRGETGIHVFSWISQGVWQDLSGSLATIGSFSLTQIADMNLDGHGDVVAVKDELVVVYTGDGAGDWNLAATIIGPEACGTAALRAGIDADHNGFPDVARVAEENCGQFGDGTNRPRFYAESSIPKSPSMYAAYPRGGEVFVAGSVRFVDWHAAVPRPLGRPTVSIELSTSGPDGPWSLLASSLANNGRYQWNMSASLPSSNNCYLRYMLEIDSDASAVTPSAFTIIGGALLGDIDGDGSVGASDLLILLANWGPCRDCDDCPADLNGDCTVGAADLLILLANWG